MGVDRGGMLTAGFGFPAAGSCRQPPPAPRLVHARAVARSWSSWRPFSPPWLPTARARSLAAAVGTGDVAQEPVDELWWKEGAPVQSLEIECKGCV